MCFRASRESQRVAVPKRFAICNGGIETRARAETHRGGEGRGGEGRETEARSLESVARRVSIHRQMRSLRLATTARLPRQFSRIGRGTLHSRVGIFTVRATSSIAIRPSRGTL